MAELTYEHIMGLFAESDKRLRKYERQRVESDKRFDLYLKKITKEFDKNIAFTNKKIAELGDTLGRFAEEQVRADILNKFKQWNIPVHAITNHFIQHYDNNDFAYEIDILIYNSKYMIAIEVKNTLRKEHVDEHIERMGKIQKYPLPDSNGKTLLAGVAGMIVGQGVDKYAENQGLFVIKPSGDAVRIMNNQETFKPKEWELRESIFPPQ